MLLKIFSFIFSIVAITASSCDRRHNIARLPVEKYTRNLTEMYEHHQLPAYVDVLAGVGKAADREPFSTVLNLEYELISGGGNHNIALVGEVGLDTDARMYALAARIYHKKAPEQLLGKQVIEINLPAIKHDLSGTDIRSQDYLDFIKKILAAHGNQIFYISDFDAVAYQEDQYGVLVKFTKETGIKPADLLGVFTQDKSDGIFSVSQKVYLGQFVHANTRSRLERISVLPFSTEQLHTLLLAEATGQEESLSDTVIENITKATRGLLTANYLTYGTEIMRLYGKLMSRKDASATDVSILYEAVGEVVGRPDGNIERVFTGAFNGNGLAQVDAILRVDPTYYIKYPKGSDLILVRLAQLEERVAGIGPLMQEQIAQVLRPIGELANTVAQLRLEVQNIQNGVNNVVADNEQINVNIRQVQEAVAHIDPNVIAQAVRADLRGDLQGMLNQVIQQIEALQGLLQGRYAGVENGLAQALLALRERQEQLQTLIRDFNQPIQTQLDETRENLRRLVEGLEQQVGEGIRQATARLNDLIRELLRVTGDAQANGQVLARALVEEQNRALAAIGSMEAHIQAEAIRVQTALMDEITRLFGDRSDIRNRLTQNSGALRALLVEQTAAIAALRNIPAERHDLREELLREQRAFNENYIRMMRENGAQLLREILVVQQRLFEEATDRFFINLLTVQREVFEEIRRTNEQESQRLITQLNEIYEARRTEATAAADEALRTLQETLSQLREASRDITVVKNQLLEDLRHLREEINRVNPDIREGLDRIQTRMEEIIRQAVHEEHVRFLVELDSKIVELGRGFHNENVDNMRRVMEMFQQLLNVSAANRLEILASIAGLRQRVEECCQQINARCNEILRLLNPAVVPPPPPAPELLPPAPPPAPLPPEHPEPEDRIFGERPIHANALKGACPYFEENGDILWEPLRHFKAFFTQKGDIFSQGLGETNYAAAAARYEDAFTEVRVPSGVNFTRNRQPDMGFWGAVANYLNHQRHRALYGNRNTWTPAEAKECFYFLRGNGR